MISFSVNIIAWIFSLAVPLSMPSAVYTSGTIRSAENCIEDTRLPDNPDKKIEPMPVIDARSFAVLSDDGHVWLAEKESLKPQAMASITKLMTALVFLDHNPGWDKDYTIRRVDLVSGGKVHLFLGDTVNLRDLFKATLIASDNGAALALSRASGLSDEAFVEAMNVKAKDLGLLQTNFVDPIGLGDSNQAHAKDIARLAQIALNQADISEAVISPNYSFQTKEGNDKFLESTDWLLESSLPANLRALGGKTGYTEAAGYSFVGRFQDQLGRSLIVVVLDSGGRNERFQQAQALANWAFTYCKW